MQPRAELTRQVLPKAPKSAKNSKMFAICLQTKKFENKIVEKPCKIRKSLCKHFCKQYKVGIRANFFIYSNVNGGEIIMVDPVSNQTDMWSAYEWSKSSQFNYFKAE